MEKKNKVIFCESNNEHGKRKRKDLNAEGENEHNMNTMMITEKENRAEGRSRKVFNVVDTSSHETFENFPNSPHTSKISSENLLQRLDRIKQEFVVWIEKNFVHQFDMYAGLMRQLTITEFVQQIQQNAI